MAERTGVGPVLEAGEFAACVLAAIRELNPQVRVQDRGAYWRVEAPNRCVLTRAAVESLSGRPFRLPGDLEMLMPSFQGYFRVSEEQALWSTEREA